MWIFGSRRNDLLALFIPGFLVFALARQITDASPIYVPLAFLALSLVDSGHVYATSLRTHFDQVERASRQAYSLVPIAVFTTFFFWAWSGVPYLWSALLYITAFHHLRQYYGIVRWYERLNGRADRPSHFFSQALTAVPVVLYHFEPGPARGLFKGLEMLAHPSANLWRAGMVLYSGLITAWVLHEIRLWKDPRTREPNRLLAVALPALLFAGCFLLGRTTAEIVFPLLIAHGVAYFFLLGLSLKRLGRYRTFRRACAIVIGFSFAFGVLEFLYEESLLKIDYEPGITALGAAILALYVTPGICHYVFDAWLWKGTHRQARQVFAHEADLPPETHRTEPSPG